MKINDIITIHPYSQYRNICEKAMIEKIGKKWITILPLGINAKAVSLKVTRFSIIESGLWKLN